ncbi:MAG: DUF72 domain-containing protein [Nitrososphaerales archaeon]|nr:DUF72 domain-containing protein [Nitrososphaerales archaeon]
MSKIKIGTSGYSYFWNEGKPTPFEWYIKQGFDTVEINASFYRFPSSTWVKAWSNSPKDFDFTIKVHRSITHYAKLRGKAIQLWKRFVEPLRTMEEKITFWLFQMPPSFRYSEKSISILNDFFKELNLGNRAVVEFRDNSWWKNVDDLRDLGIVFCSVDAPELPRDIVMINDVVYLRLHGRDVWYNYEYTDEELNEIVNSIKRLPASRKYIYLNNDHGMLTNGKYLMKIIRGER